MKQIYVWGIIAVIGALLIGGAVIFFGDEKNDEVKESPNILQTKENTHSEAIDKVFNSHDLFGVDSHFQFTASIPSSWQAEYVSESQAINFYVPPEKSSIGTTLQSERLDSSKIFVKYFIADKFLTLTTVDIRSRLESVINGRQAVTYVIAKKPSIKNFPNQPIWRNEKHTVTDIRSSGDSPTVFYVFAKSPLLPENDFKNFLESVRFVSDEKSAILHDPLERLAERTIKKPFGILISQENFPIQPERFSGYHTGVDFEILPGEEKTNVFTHAVSDGTIVSVRKASGYGGVVVIQHVINGKKLYGIYGHLRLSSVLPEGIHVKKGDVFGALGEGGTAETDFERKHLHFGLYQGEPPNILGYVENKNELSNWVDPMLFY